MTGRLLMLGTDKPTTWIVYNELVARFGPFPILIEKGVSRWWLIRTRIRHLGFVNVASQLAFLLLIRPLLRRLSANRVRYLLRQLGLEPVAPKNELVHDVASVNSDDCRAYLRKYQPDVVIVNGTRIIGKATLGTVKAPFINTHHGITPRYRGAHGAYWALLEKRREECGVTVHIVDEGIDTGNIIAHAYIRPERSDTFITYPILQTTAALEHIVSAVRSASSGQLATRPVSGESRVWYHPGFFQYIAGAIRGVW